MHSIKHIFFDLDHTLWDFEKNTYQSIHKIFHELFPDHESNWIKFISDYQISHNELWTGVLSQTVTKADFRFKRFELPLRKNNLYSPEKANQFADRYLTETPQYPHLTEGVHKTLSDLKQKGFKLHIISNGFHLSQKTKLKHAGISEFFSTLTTSEQTGYSKPDVRIFYAALNRAKAQAKQSLMVGDNLEKDVVGAKRVGMHALHFNPTESANLNRFKIQQISEIIDYLEAEV